MFMTLTKLGLISALLLSLCAEISNAEEWSKAQIRELSSMSLTALELAPDPTNRISDDSAAIVFGQKLFFDKRFSSNGQVSCATCHDPEKSFQDGLPLGVGVGKTNRRTMPIAGSAHSPFLFWDGRKDSLWSQALGPLENPVEHGGTRAQIVHLVAENYRTEYEQIFGELPDLTDVPLNAGPVEDQAARWAWNQLSKELQESITSIFVNIGKAIAAYERTIKPGRSRFDDYVDALAATGNSPEGLLNEDEREGLKLFISQANCTQCHNGPLLTNNDFHNTGIPSRLGASPSPGRMAGIAGLLNDEFNCLSRWSDARPEQCVELNYLVTESSKLEGAFKVPSLRNTAKNAPYMHAGQFSKLSDVLEHYNNAPSSLIGRSELVPLGLSGNELRQIEAFLQSLSY